MTWFFFIFYVVLTSAQNDFVATNKYAAFNNITTINLQVSSNYVTIISPSITKSSSNPLFGQDKPWEPRIDNGYPNVIYSPNTMNKNKTFQLWYDDFITTNPRIEGTLYAESIDGIKWTKPNLGINIFNGSTDNNIMFIKSGGVGIFKDVYTSNKTELYKAFGVLPHTKGTAVSPNGIYNWTNFRKLNLNNRYDDHQNMFYDNRTNEYIAITRGPVAPPRTIAIAHNQPNTGFDSPFTNATVVESGGNINQTYSQITFKYYNIYLGLVMIFYSNDPNGRVFCELSFSTDLKSWYRVNAGQQLIPLSPLNSTAFDSHVCFAAAYPIKYNDKILLYYMGGNGPHSGNRNSSFGLATIRLDGFAGITNKNNNSVATVETFPLLVDGKYMIVTIDTMNAGNVKVGLLGINGFGIDDCTLIKQDVTDYIVDWNGKKDLSNIIGQRIKIQFQLLDSVLYTFGFVNDTHT